MLIMTERFGAVRAPDDAVILFPEGILGFEHLKRFVLVERGPEDVIRFLQPVDDPSVAFAVMDPHVFRPDYAPQLWDEDRAALRCRADSELAVLVILTVPQDVRQMTANLMAPVIVNVTERLGRQVVQGLGEYATRHRVAEELERARRLVLPWRKKPDLPVVRPEEVQGSLRQTV